MRPGDHHRATCFIKFSCSFYDCSAAAHLCHKPFFKNNANAMKQLSFGFMKETAVMTDSLRKCHFYLSKTWESRILFHKTGEELFCVFDLDMSLYLNATKMKFYFVTLTRNEGNQEAF